MNKKGRGVERNWGEGLGFYFLIVGMAYPKIQNSKGKEIKKENQNHLMKPVVLAAARGWSDFN